MKHPAPKTSAVITAHNYGKYLVQCLDSVFAQTLPFSEVILIDDDSTDDTEEIWRLLYRDRVRYEKVCYHSQLPVRRHGFRISTGDFIVFIDADDWLEPAFHEKLIAPLLEDPYIGITYCGMNLFLDAKDLSWFRFSTHTMRPFDPRRLWISNYIPPASIFRREAWPTLDRPYGGGVFESGCTHLEDWDTWIQMAADGWEGRLIEERLSYYRIHGGNHSRPGIEDAETNRILNWNIKERFITRELSIVYLYRGDQPINRCVDFIERLEKPKDTEIIFFNGFAPVRAHSARLCATYYEEICRLRNTSQWKRLCLERARHYARGKYVLFLTDHFSYPEDLYPRLKQGLEAARAEACSASVRSRRYARTLAWRTVKGDPHNGVRFVSTVRGPKRIFAAELSGTLMTAAFFHQWPLNPGEDGKLPFPSPEFTAGAFAHKRDMRWFVDGRIRSLRGRAALAGGPCPPVSIVIPVKDSRRDLRKLLESIGRLDYPKDRLEVIVVDNNSRDGSAEAARSFPWVRVLYEKKPSSYAARNLGIRESRHDLIAFVDADCRVTRRWLKELVHGMEEDAWAGIVAGANRSLTPRARLTEMERRTGGYFNHAGSTVFPPFAMTMNVLFRREVFAAAGLFDEGEISGSDVEMSLRTQACTRFGVKILVNRAIVGHRDAVTLASYIRRAVRIGHGVFGLFRKHPYLPAIHYFWLPLTRRELVLQFLKRLRRHRKELPKDAPKERWEDVRFAEWRLFLKKIGYLKALREDRKKEAAEPSSACMIYIGNEGLKNNAPQYGWVSARAAEGIRVLNLDPEKPPAASWFQALGSLAGLTAVWYWRRRLRSMELWSLLGGGRMRKWNDAVNTIRAKKILGLKKEDVLYFSGDTDAASLLRWKAAFGHEKTRLWPRNLAVSFDELVLLRSPFTACLVKNTGTDADLALFEKIAAVSSWPVLVAGKVDEETLPLLQDVAARTKNLYFLAAEITDTLVERILERTALAVYACGAKSGEEIDAAGIITGRRHHPHVIALTNGKGAAADHVRKADSAVSLIRAVRQFMLQPIWPRCAAAPAVKAESAPEPAGSLY